MSSGSTPLASRISAASLVASGRKFQTPQYAIEIFIGAPRHALHSHGGRARKSYVFALRPSTRVQHRAQPLVRQRYFRRAPPIRTLQAKRQTVDTNVGAPDRPGRVGVAMPETQEIRRPRHRRTDTRAPITAGLALCLAFSGCAIFDPPSPDAVPDEMADAKHVTAIYERAGIDRARQLEVEVERLRTDLREAEESMVAIEAGLRALHGRADAVSALAESKIALERAARNAPWRSERLLEAQQKLDDAEDQLRAGHTASAVFFASRARRIADALNAEAKLVANTRGTRFIKGRRVNLRAGPSVNDPVLDVLVDATPVFPEQRDGEWLLLRTPSGQVGWVHASLLREGAAPSSDTTTQSLPDSFAR
jgi:hypothetical protein